MAAVTKGAISASDAASELVAEDAYRGEVVLQHLSGDPVYLSFGTETPVVGQGLVLSADFPVIVVDDHRAKKSIKGICDTGESATGSYSTDRA